MQLKIDMKIICNSVFVIDYGHLLNSKYHKINLNHCGSYIDSPDWINQKTDNEFHQ